MTLPEGLFALLIYAALVVVIAAPVILAVLWVRDRKRGTLW